MVLLIVKMGWYKTLEVECILLPEFVDFYKNNYMRDIGESEEFYSRNNCTDCMRNDIDNIKCICTYVNPEHIHLTKDYKDLIDIWIELDIGHRFYEYVFDESTRIFRCEITKKVTSHRGYLEDDYHFFLSDIIVPTTSEIISCRLFDDESYITRHITDNELRRNSFNLPGLVKSVHHTWDNGVIIGSTVIYKRSIKKSQEIDLNRCYGLESL